MPIVAREMEQAITTAATASETVSTWVTDRLRFMRKRLVGSQLETVTGNLEHIADALTPEEQQDFFSDDYVVENFPYMTHVRAEKIKLALGVREAANEVLEIIAQNKAIEQSVTQTLEEIGEGQPQYVEPLHNEFMPAMNLAAYVTLEFVEEAGLQEADGQTIKEAVVAQLADENLLEGKRTLLRKLAIYLDDVEVADLSGQDLIKEVARRVATDTYRKIEQANADSRWLGQSQGIEVEVLKYTGSAEELSPAETRRGIDPKWLPRGVPVEEHARTDWQILPLLGVHEDIGERAYQVFEMATDPTETMAAQSRILYDLIRGGFISEGLLSDDTKGNPDRRGKEAFSLHVSTVFPTSIVTKASLAEYQLLARTLAGVYATDQRLGYGGFMSGGSEVTDKSTAGNLKRLDKMGPEIATTIKVPDGLSLIETRNLDISLRGQFPALRTKEVMDFAFRAAWQRHYHPLTEQSLTESYAADQWRSFMSKVQELFGRYGMSSRQLQKKYGKSWERHAWKELSRTREEHPEFKKELDRLLRSTARDIRLTHKKFVGIENAVAEGFSLEGKYYMDRRFLVREPKSQARTARIYLNRDQRKRLEVKLGDKITLQVGDKEVTVTVDKARRRGNDTIEASTSPYLRLSAIALERLGLPDYFATTPLYFKEDKRLQLLPVELDDLPVITNREPRGFSCIEHDDTRHIFHLNLEDRKRLGVQLGDEITVRFGHARVTATVGSAQLEAHGLRRQLDLVNWQISRSMSEALSLPENARMRSRWDSTSGEFVLGPSIAIASKLTENADGSIALSDEELTQATLATAKHAGAFACVFDMEKQDPQQVESGSITAYILNSNRVWEKTIVPIPDVLYDRTGSKRTKVSKAVADNFEYDITPDAYRTIFTDVFKLSEVLHEEGLSDNYPEAVKLADVEDVEDLLSTGKAVLRPRFDLSGAGVIEVTKTDEGNYQMDLRFPNGTLHRMTTVTSVEVALDIIKKYAPKKTYVAQAYTPDYTQSENTVFTAEVTMQRGIDGTFSATNIVFTPTVESSTPISPEVKTQVREIAAKVAKAVDKHVHGYVAGETAYRFVMDTQGELHVLDAKDRADVCCDTQDNIYQHASRPVEYALFMTGMN